MKHVKHIHDIILTFGEVKESFLFKELKIPENEIKSALNYLVMCDKITIENGIIKKKGK